MINELMNIFRGRTCEKMITLTDREYDEMGLKLKKHIDSAFAGSLAIRELDSGSDNLAELELVNLTTPHYDVERYGVSFVASPRHADVLIVTGSVTLNMEAAVRKTYEAMPHPKFVIALGDDACTGGIMNGSYAVLGGVDRILPVDLKIPGNPPTPTQILKGLLTLIKAIEDQRD